ncbi:MAG: FAD-dependent oxidoreductase [Flavobacteriaceae bacterium]|nr:FAD-dependent oxidoreductase [Flavobacteriaceae bacterium]
MFFDVLVIGGGAAGMSCALVLGSAKKSPFASEKNIGIVLHQRTSVMENAIFYNVLGVKPGTTGKEIMESGIAQLSDTYPHIAQIKNEKVNLIKGEKNNFTVSTNKNTYQAKMLVIAVDASNLFQIEGLMEAVIPHEKIQAIKQKIQLKNLNHLVKEGIFVAGVLAGHRSQFAIACGSGTQVATDILTEWNNGISTVIHDAIEK